MRAFLHLLIGAFGLLGLTGCLGDPDPDPATAPIEVVAIDKDAGSCVLNGDEVAAGRHQVFVITEDAQTTVELHDASGKVLFVQKGETQKEDSVKLAAGEYTFVCRYRGGPTRETGLTVVPK